MAAMRILQSLGQFMDRVCVEEIATKTGQTVLVLFGAFGYAMFDQCEEVIKRKHRLHEAQAECKMLKKRLNERNAAYSAKKDDLLVQMAIDLARSSQRE